MAEKNTVAMFVQGENGERIQVGWASPKDESGVRTFEYSEGFQGTSPKDVSFDDDELTQLVAEEQHEARLTDGTDGEEFQVEVHEEYPEGFVPLPEVPLTPVDQSSLLDTKVSNVPEPVDASPDETQDAERVEDAPDAEQADDPTDASAWDDEPVELNSGGEILEAEEDDADEQTFTRRDFRDNQD